MKRLLVVLIVFMTVIVTGLTASAEKASIFVVAISGFNSDATAKQIAGEAARGTGNSGVYQLLMDLKRSGCKTQFFNWNGTTAGSFAKSKGAGAPAIARLIREASAESGFKQLVLIGHSWGGHTMLDVAEILGRDPTIKIELAVGLDASSFSRAERTKRLPSNIQELVNYYSNNAFCWGEWNDGARIVNVSLADQANGFVVDGKPDYASQLSWDAHYAAEWDQKIHSDICKRVLALATVKENTSRDSSADELPENVPGRATEGSGAR